MLQDAPLKVLVDCLNDLPPLGNVSDGLCRDEVLVVVLQPARGGHQVVHIHAFDKRANSSTAHGLLIAHGIGDATREGSDTCHDSIAPPLVVRQGLHYHGLLPRVAALEDYADQTGLDYGLRHRFEGRLKVPSNIDLKFFYFFNFLLVYVC